ncbi:hypothetical protein [Caproicibacter fermentans]|uniref:Uncharacterized protein n=1 Tax=Caproicibacter fermentans TaxID=2576756 RepID=A0A7G8TD12_9FIRM|nr:hypothetical protein [Caproicibacter fermentans]QNK41503.1 hypothetical protein HCR03_04330 [Caproicibacter fermentans]
MIKTKRMLSVWRWLSRCFILVSADKKMWFQTLLTGGRGEDTVPGLFYGPWNECGCWGWRTFSFKDTAEAMGLFAAVLTPLMPDKVTQVAASEIAVAFQGLAYVGGFSHFYRGVQRTRREAYYPNGTFAFSEFRYEIQTYLVDDEGNTHDLGTITQLYHVT